MVKYYQLDLWGLKSQIQHMADQPSPRPDRLLFFDTTLRDGEQSPGCSMNTEEKLRIARKLQEVGVDILEAGFPVASKGDFDAVQRIAEEVRGVRVAALARCMQGD